VEELVALGERVLGATDASYRTEGQEVVVRPSVGAVLLRPGGRADDSLQAADAAMYAAKAAGGGRVWLGEEQSTV
jgi:GGDEF domain-containing protein